MVIRANVHRTPNSDEPEPDTPAANFADHPRDDFVAAAPFVEDDGPSIFPTPTDVETANAQALTPRGPALIELSVASQPARQASTPPPEIRQLMDSYADAIPAFLPLEPQVQHPTEYRTQLIPESHNLRHRAHRLSTEASSDGAA